MCENKRDEGGMEREGDMKERREGGIEVGRGRERESPFIFLGIS